LGTDTILLQVAPTPVCLSYTGAKATAVFIPAAQAKLLFAASPSDSVAPRSDFSSVVESLLCSELCSRVRPGVPRLSVSSASSVIEDCPCVIAAAIGFDLLCCLDCQIVVNCCREKPV
jgi:hypothetical protein